jgi:hypothetical protein
LIAWAENSIETLSDEAPALSPFIQAFARPINVESMPANLSPTYIGFDVPQLTEDILEVPEKIRFVRGTGDAAVAVTKMILTSLSLRSIRTLSCERQEVSW